MGVLEGKVAVITGSTRGLGLAIAQAYAREGAAVVVSSRTPRSVEQAVEGLKVQGYRVAGLPCDVADLDQVEALAETAVREFGRLDVWVNNAGLSAPYGPTASIPPEYINTVIQTNILGTYHGSLAALRRFTAQRSGKLINLLGRGAKNPVPFQNAYASSKAWVRSFSKTMAKEYKDSGAGIYLFNPGLVLTDMVTQVEGVAGYTERLKALNTVLRLWGNPPEIPAQKAVWLASEATDGKTGLEVSMLSTGRLVGGAVKELVRRVLGKPSEVGDIEVREVKQ
jgi:NAD(P)-dependent dehydrogenase (short-subunit alcohol dehydrogenase family)